MDLENQKRVKDFAEQYGAENIVVVLGAAEGEAAGLAAETVTAGDPTFAGPLAGVQLGLSVFHVCENEIKDEVDSSVYDDQISMMEMVMDVDDIAKEMSSIQNSYIRCNSPGGSSWGLRGFCAINGFLLHNYASTALRKFQYDT